MKKQILLFGMLISITIVTTAQELLRLDGATAPTGSQVSAVYQGGATGQNIGIGIAGPTGPAAALHVYRNTSAAQLILSEFEADNNQPDPDLFVARRVNPGNILYPTSTHFIVKGDGKVGIGTAEPQTILTVKALPPVDVNDLLNNEPPFGIVDQNDEPLLGLWNFTNGSHRGAGLFISGYDDIDPNTPLYPAILVLDEANQRLPFAVASNGLIAIGHDVTNWFEPFSQIDFRKYNNYDYMLNIGDQSGLSGSYFNIKNSGEVGIGIPSQPNVALTIGQLSNTSGNYPARLDLISTPTSPAFLRFTSGTTTIRHQITEAGGDLVIQPGVTGGGANAMVKVEGKLKIGDLYTYINSGIHTDAHLFVGGKIAARSCIITVNSWADDVFAEDYKLMPLNELDGYIKNNKHLPGIPSEAEVKSNGLSVGDSDAQLLRKIEELTLYTLQLKKEIEELKSSSTNH